MSHLDAAGDPERAEAGRTRVARHHIAQVDDLGLGEVATPVDAAEVLVHRIGAADEIGHPRRGMVGIDAQGEPHGADEARLAASGGTHLLGRRHPERREHAGQLLRLHRIQLVVAPHDERNHAAVRGLDQQRLDAPGGLDGEERAQLGDRAHARGRDPGHRGRCRRPWPARRRRGCHLQVRGVVVRVREHDGVLARIRQYVEFLRGASTDAAGVGVHRAKPELHAREDPRVGLVHRLVALLERGGVEVEGIGILHRELARAHHAEAGADLVAELGLDLVEIDRQLPVALEFAPREVRDDLLVRRAVTERAIVPVPDPEQFRAELFPAARFLPELRGLHRGHQQFDRARAIHFLADDCLDLAQHPEPDRQPRVQARRETPDEARPQHEPVAHDLGIGGHVAQGVDGVTGESHRASAAARNRPRMLPEGGLRPARCDRGRRCAATCGYLSCREPHCEWP